MITKLLNMYRQLSEKLQHNEAKDRGPVPPVRNRTRPPVVNKASTTPATQASKSTEASEPTQPNKKNPAPSAGKTTVQTSNKENKQPSETITRIASRGNNKNVFVEIVPGQDADDALHLADEAADPKLETIQDGLDPYNSGVYSTKQVWRDQR